MMAALPGLLALALAGAQAPAPPDEERAAWAFRRSVLAPAGEASGFAALALPPELMARSRPDLRDLRLVGSNGRELPYVVQARVERERTTSWRGALADVKREAKRSSVYTVDLGEPRRFDRILLTIPARGFAKRVRAEISTDGRRWREVVGDAGVFDRPWTPPVHHTTLALPEPVSARWVRLGLDDRRSQPQDVTAVAVALVASLPGEEWRRAAALLPLAGRSGVSRYAVEAPAGLAFETLRLDSDDPAFSRRVSLVESFERDGQRQERHARERPALPAAAAGGGPGGRVADAAGHAARGRRADPRSGGRRQPSAAAPPPRDLRRGAAAAVRGRGLAHAVLRQRRHARAALRPCRAARAAGGECWPHVRPARRGGGEPAASQADPAPVRGAARSRARRRRLGARPSILRPGSRGPLYPDTRAAGPGRTTP